MTQENWGQNIEGGGQAPEGGQAPNPQGANQPEPIPPVGESAPDLGQSAPNPSSAAPVPNYHPVTPTQNVPPAPAGGEDYMNNLLSGNDIGTNVGADIPLKPTVPDQNTAPMQDVQPPAEVATADQDTQDTLSPQGQGMQNAPEQNYIPEGQPPSTMPPQEGGKKMNIWIPIVVLVIVAIAAAAYFLFLRKPTTTEQTTSLFQESTEVTTTTDKFDATRQSDLKNLQEALEKYFLKNQKYPVSKIVIKTQDPDNALSALVPDFIAKLPQDPAGSDKYYGYKSEDGKTYELSAVFDSAPDEIKSSKIEKGYLVVLTPGLTFSKTETTSSTTSTSSSSSS